MLRANLSCSIKSIEAWPGDVLNVCINVIIDKDAKIKYTIVCT